MSGPTTHFKLKADMLKALSARRNGPALLRAGLHFGLVFIGMAITWRVRGTGWMVPMLWITGYPLAFLFNILHETAHKTAFKTPWMNNVAGHMAGFLVLLPYEYYRAFHWDHHRYTQQPGKDPEMGVNLPHSLLGYSWLMLGFPLWYRRTIPLLLKRAGGHCALPWITDEKRPMIVRESRLYLLGYGLIAALSIAMQSWAAIYVWLVPLAAGHMLLRPYLLAEHTGCAETRDMFENTRTTYTNAVVRWFAWNMPYHVEHHAYPAVPFHSLPHLNELSRSHLQHTANGYIDASNRVRRFLLRGVDQASH